MPGEVHDPRPAAVTGNRLPVGMTGGGEVRPDGADHHGAAVERIGPDELDAAVLEAADHRRRHLPDRGAGEVHAPLAVFKIIEENSHPVPMAALRAVRIDLLHLSAAVPELAHRDLAGHL